MQVPDWYLEDGFLSDTCQIQSSTYHAGTRLVSGGRNFIRYLSDTKQYISCRYQTGILCTTNHWYQTDTRYSSSGMYLVLEQVPDRYYTGTCFTLVIRYQIGIWRTEWYQMDNDTRWTSVRYLKFTPVSPDVVLATGSFLE